MKIGNGQYAIYVHGDLVRITLHDEDNDEHVISWELGYQNGREFFEKGYAATHGDEWFGKRLGRLLYRERAVARAEKAAK
jgi:hypothetical protein